MNMNEELFVRLLGDLYMKAMDDKEFKKIVMRDDKGNIKQAIEKLAECAFVVSKFGVEVYDRESLK